MAQTFIDFSGRNVGPVVRFEYPQSLAELVEVVRRAESDGLSVHACGSKWAFSAPGYCEGVVVETARLNRPLPWLQAHVVRPERGASVLVGMEAGIQIRELYSALEGHPLFPAQDLGPLLRGRRLSLPTLGGAGGQRLAGLTQTGTHGGDVARPPIGDFLHALLVVGSGGVVRVIERPGEPALDVDALTRTLRSMLGSTVPVVHEQHPDAFDAAIVAAGRLGVVYAGVYEVHDETDQWVYVFRRKEPWSAVRVHLLADVAAAAAADEHLTVVANPMPEETGDRMCYVTRQATRPQASESDAGVIFGLGPSVPSTPLPPRSSDLAQMFCVSSATPTIVGLQQLLLAAGLTVIGAIPFAGPLLAAPLFEAAASLARIGPRHLLGDVLAETLNTVGRVPLVGQSILRTIVKSILDGALPDQLGGGLFSGPGRRPYLVHGTRPAVSDGWDYTSNCYQGDSIEVFFPVDAALPGIVEEVFVAFDRGIREQTPSAAYLSLRFCARSRAVLAMAAWSPTCALEVSMLRGVEGNTALMDAITEITVRHGGRVHWGQRNTVPVTVVRSTFGADLDRFHACVTALEGDSPLFSNRFSRDHGLDPEPVEAWQGWTEMGQVLTGPPTVVPAAGAPLQVLGVGPDATLVTTSRSADGSAAAWERVLPGQPVALDARPAAVRNPSGTLDVYVRAARGGRSDDRLLHTWENDRAGGGWSGWSVAGAWAFGAGARVDLDPTLVAHLDGRLEAFCRELTTDGGRLLHTYQQLWPGGPWSGLDAMGPTRLGSAPSACLRLQLSDGLVVATTTESGTVSWTAQHGPGGDSGWGPLTALAGPDGRTLAAAHVIAAGVTGPGAAAHVLAVELGTGLVNEAVANDRVLALSWQDWQPLPPPPERLDQTGTLTWAQSTQLSLFARSERGRVLTIDRDPATGWGTWSSLGGTVGGDLAAGVLDDGRVEVFACRRTDNRLMARRQTTPGSW